MKLYHITLNANRESIEEKGILTSKSGIDGPGVYVFNGPLSEALKNADLSLSDSWDTMSDDELNQYYKTLIVFEADLPDDIDCTIIWEDYRVLREAISPDKIKFIGNFYELLKGEYK